MSTGKILKQLRNAAVLSQQELADRIHVTRQAVSRWENDETIPGPDTLKALSAELQVSVDALLESDVIRYCECCGMPLEPSIYSQETDGSLNPRYCKWCYHDGDFPYKDMEQMITFLCENFPQPGKSPEETRQFFHDELLRLPYWQQLMAK